MTQRRRAPAAPLVEIAHCDVVLAGRHALSDVSFAVRAGERWAVIGPNGAGKTLLLKLIRGDVWPTPSSRESRIYMDVHGPASQPPGLGERWPYVGPERQDRYERYDWNFTVREVVTTGLYDEDMPLTSPTRAESARITRLLERFGLTRLARRRLLSLSYGQRRLAMIARAFSRPAPLLLLDEVFNGLDIRIRGQLMKALDQSGGRIAWLLSAHRVEDVPPSANRLLRLEAGRIVEQRPLRRGDLDRLQSTRRPRARSAPRTGTQHPAPPDNERWSFRIANADVYRDYRPVLRQLTWTVRAGEHWAIVGPNGAGKSTLLKLIYGDLHPAWGGVIERGGHRSGTPVHGSGTPIEVWKRQVGHRSGTPSGTPIHGGSGTPIEVWKRQVGFVSPELQADHAHAGTLEDIVVSGLRASVGLNEPATVGERRRARRWLRYFGIEALGSRRTREVSYGQMRLALLARAMVARPKLLLLDEPCTGLDPAMRARVQGLLEGLARDGVQIILAVHHREDMIDSITHCLEILRDGRVRIGRSG